MAVKKTIAIVGATEKAGAEIANRFSCMPFRLLLISNDLKELSNLFEELSEKKPVAEIDKIDCVKEGCWEADIIILAVPVCEEKEVVQRMKEVSTQKIVVTVSEGHDPDTNLNKMLPYSKLVKVSGNLESKEIFISGENETVNEEIISIFNQAGFQAREIFKKVNN